MTLGPYGTTSTIASSAFTSSGTGSTHHEPIHQRNLHRDHQGLRDVAAWICADTEKWIVASSRVSSVLAERL